MIDKITIPAGEKGDWKIIKFSVSKEDARIFNLGRLMSHQGSRIIQPGNYTKLIRHNTLVMSDTPAEMNDHYEIIQRAMGHVLINGLGLGMIAQACLRKPEVGHVTVVEISEDLIELVGSHYKKMYNGQLTIVHADAFEYSPPKGTRYNAVWHDIWDDINSDNWEQYKRLHRKYGRKTDWQGSWGRRDIQRMLREEREYGHYPWNL